MAIVVDKLGVEKDEVVPEASFTETFNADSLDQVELIMAFEEEFTHRRQRDFHFRRESEQIITVQDAIDYLRGQGVGNE